MGVCYPNNAPSAYPVWVEGQTLGLPYLLPHEPSMVLNGAQPMGAVDIVDLDGLIPCCTTEEEPIHTFKVTQPTTHAVHRW